MDIATLRAELQPVAKESSVLGTILLASEGINGTIAASEESLDAFWNVLTAYPQFKGLEYKDSFSVKAPFLRLKIKLKKEIITFRNEESNPEDGVGQYVDPADWNALITNPDVVVIDTRNDYEVDEGTFKGSIDPKITKFTELKPWIEEHLKGKEQTPVAMFCTGGIRCEKSTALLKSMGFENVYHLRGGILRYLETIDESESLYEGNCFVFDQRRGVEIGLKEKSLG